MTDAEIVIGIRGDVSGGKVIQRTLDDISKSGEKAQNNTEQLKNKLTGVNGAALTLQNTLRGLGLAFGLRELQQLSDSYTNIQNRLKLVTASAQELKGVQGELTRISIETRSSLEATATLYSRLTFATKGLGISQKEILTFTEQLNKQLLVGGSSAQEAAATVFQLTQAFNKGKLDGDEFRTVLEAAPTILEALQVSVGRTRDVILQMAADGQLGPRELVKAINEMADTTDLRFAAMGQTIGQAFEVLKTRTMDAVGNLNQATGATDFLGFAISKLGDVIGILSNELAAVAYTLKAVFTSVVGSILTITTAIINSIEAVVNTAIRGINLIKKEDLPLMKITGLTASDFMTATNDSVSSDYKNAGKSLANAGQSGLSLLGYKRTDTKPFQASNDPGEIIKRSSASSNANAIKEAEKAQQKINDVTNSLKFNLEQLKRNDTEQAIYNNLKQAGVSIDSAAGKNIAELTRQYETNSQQLEKQKNVINSLAGVTEGFFKSWFTGSEGFKGAVKGMIGQLADLAFQFLVVDKIKNNLFGGSSGGGGGIFGALLGGLGGIFGGGAKVPAGAYTAALRGAANPSLYGPGFASGGSMTLGGNSGTDQNILSLNGAPIARTGRGEVLSISPNQRGGGSTVVNQTINLSMGVQEAVAAQFATMLPQLQKSTMQAINEAQDRGIKTL